jgi:hypothetical protein
MISSSFKKTFVYFSLFSLISETVYPAAVLAENYLKDKRITKSISGNGDGTPIADAAGGMVDKYTGDFHYSVPLMNVPGPNGENVDISASYHGGIRADERASWIGLGWDYNPGEITRQLVGAPDDYTGQDILRSYILPFSTSGVFQPIKTYGPFYYDKIATSNSNPYGYIPANISGANAAVRGCDEIAIENPYDYWNYKSVVSACNAINYYGVPTHFGKPSATYAAAAYDKYYVTGPNISGKLHPYTFTNVLLYKAGSAPSTYTKPDKTQFYFDNSTNKNILTKGDAPSDNRIKSGYFVKHYTNADINYTSTSTNCILFKNNTQIGFLDYRTIIGGARRPSADFDPNGIGGIEVTDPNGLTYHYSLPVYNQHELNKELDINANDISLGSSNVTGFAVNYKYYKYATSWKLTAITGPDYQDANNNYIADEGDTGYWIAYNYSLWNNFHLWSSSFFNANEQLNPTRTNIEFLKLSGFVSPSFKKTFSINQGQSQIYYLNYIQTSTHIAFFVKDQRLDEHSYEKVLNSSASPDALLKLSKIILLRNEDKNLLLNSTNWSTATVDSRFNPYLFSACDVNLIHIQKYNLNKAQIDQKSLKTIEFNTDYSLCKMLYNNINNSFTTSAFSTSIPGTYSMVDAFEEINNFSDVVYRYYDKTTSSSTDSNNSGKLTLNEIISYEDGYKKVFPSYLFDYDKTNKNPNYDPDKADLWGYYKSDYNGPGCSHFCTYTSAKDADVWSLKEVTTPTGGKIKIEYEGDEYSAEGYTDDPWGDYTSIGLINQPYLIYPLKSMSLGSSWNSSKFEYNDYASVWSDYTGTGATTAGVANILNKLVVPSLDACNVYLGTPIIPGGLSIMVYYTGLISSWSSSTSGNNTLFDFYCFRPSSTSTPGYDVKPNIASNCNGYGNQITSAYNKSNGYGYAIMRFNKLYGGGTRIKSVTINDPANGDNYKQSYSYQGGYCPVVPKPCSMSPETEMTTNMLWQNLKLFLPEGPGSNVGYSTITVKNIDKYGNNNGYTEYKYNNSVIQNPIQSNASMSQSPIVLSNCSPFSSCSNNMPPYSIKHSLQRDFWINSVFSNGQIKKLGKLASVESFNNSSTTVFKTSYDYDISKYISERYYSNFDQSISIGFSWPCFNATGPGTNSVSVTCHDYDNYHYNNWNYNYSCFLSKVTKEVDGIVTTILYDRNPDTGDIMTTTTSGSNFGIVTSNKTYAYLINSKLSFKASNEQYKNQVLLPDIINSEKRDYGSPGVGYLTGEKKFHYSDTFNYREYNTSSGYYENNIEVKNWLNGIRAYERLLDDNTPIAAGSPKYRRVSKNSLFNSDNALLEAKGLNDRIGATKLGYNNTLKLASISNANYNSFTFSSYEDEQTVATNVKHFGGEVKGIQFKKDVDFSSWTTSGPVPTSIILPHTGFYFAKVPPYTNGPTFTSQNFETARTYQAKVWVHKNSPAGAKLAIVITGTDISNNPLWQYADVSRNNSNNITVGDWVLMSVELTAGYVDLTKPHSMNVFVLNTSTTSNAYFDDFAVHPVDAPITGNVYDERTGRLIASLDDENYASYFNYDEAGRIISTYKETRSYGKILVSEKEYHNSRP